jgi:hypothetical protein
MRIRFAAMVLASLTSLALFVSAQQSTLKVKPTSDSSPKKAASIGNGPSVTAASQNAKALQGIEKQSMRAPRQPAAKKPAPVTKIAEDKNPPINFGGQGAQKAGVVGGTDPYKGRLRTKGGDGHN